MSSERPLDLDAPSQHAVGELQDVISQSYSNARFSLSHGDDPEANYLRATVDLDDVDEVVDSILDRLYEVQVERGLPIDVIPLQPIERVLRETAV